MDAVTTDTVPSTSSTASVVSSAPLQPSAVAMEDPRMSKSRVEKLKRRIIRAVGGKISQNPDEKEMENMWEIMQRSCKCDCKMLWKHMRAVTLKKLKRLLPADDRIENITSIARLTMTDWLLYDLILVHENIDVIGQDLWEKIGEEPEPLMELFFLVDEYKIEQLSGNELIDSWLKLTREYNDGGRKCSPMLLQRRWYQLKECTRKAFYTFWFNYRGNNTYVEKAIKYKPTALQVDIVSKYKSLVVNPFPDWSELIEKKKVILAHEFDNYISACRKGLIKDTEEPDLLVVEPNIEIINLEDDSDSENSKDVDKPKEDFGSISIKIENQNIDLIDVDEEDINFLKKTNIPCETPFSNDEDEPRLVISRDSDDANQMEESDATDLQTATDDDILKESNDIDFQVSAIVKNNNKSKCNSDTAQNTEFDLVNENDDSNKNSNIACDDYSDDDITEITDIFNPSKIKIETPFFTTSETDITKSNLVKEEYRDTSQIENTVKIKSEQEYQGVNDIVQLDDQVEQFNLPIIESVTSIQSEFSSTESVVKNLLAKKATELAQTHSKMSDFYKDLVIQDVVSSVSEGKIENDGDLLGNFEELPKDLQFLDDGIVVDEEEEIATNTEEKSDLGKTTKELSNETECHKIDLKLLLYSTVYTKKLDDMDVFKLINYDHIQDRRVIERAEFESKPVNVKADELKDIHLPKVEEQSVKKKFDSSDNEENLIDALYQTNPEEQNVFVKTEFTLNKDLEYRDYEGTLSNHKDYTHKTKDLKFQSNEDDTSSDEGGTPLNATKNRIHVKNSMFQKPHVQNYNPIQLCKNPDFNTRLKRLTAGFLSYESNRNYLKRCHPVTIDVQKTFERNLINNTLYLKGVETNINKPNISIKNMPDTIQCFEKKSEFFDVKETTSNFDTSNSLLCERNKVINLPDITEIRRVNQNLLTAEVAPLQIVSPFTNTSGNDEQSLSDIKNADNATCCTANISESNCNNNGTMLAENVASTNKVCDEIAERIPDSRSNKSINKKGNVTKKPYFNYYPFQNLSWRIRHVPKIEESLLASDTVDKILALLTGQKIEVKKKSKGKKCKLNTPKRQKLNEKKDVDKKEMNQNVTEATQTDETTVIKTPEEALAVLSITKKKRRKSVCCWAMKKLLHPNLKRKHPCKRPFCTCCCRGKLLQKYIKKKEEMSLTQNKPTLSDEAEMSTESNVVNIDDHMWEKSVKQTPSIVVDGNTKKINVPKFIVRSQTSRKNIYESQDSNSKSIDAPHIYITSKSVEVTNITSAENNNPIDLESSSNQLQNSTFKIMQPTETEILYNQLTESNTTNTPLLSTLNPNNHLLKHVISPQKTVRLKVKKKCKTSSSPIFLGENKILLSTIKGPMSKPIAIDTPKIPLPNGVYFVLLPNNELALSIEPGVELEVGELKHLQLVIQALQKVLGVPEKIPQNSSTDGNEPITINNEKVNTEDSIDNNYNTLQTNHNDEQLEEEKTSNNGDNVAEDENYKNLETDYTNHNQNCVSEASCTELGLTKENINNERSIEDTNRKTILSDLMEMSGISEEDAKLPESSVLPVSATTTVRPIIPSDSTNLMNASEMHSDLLALFKNPVAISALANRPDLSIITAYSDLRYAFDHNAKFFKMDVFTGEIIQINILIKKRDQAKSPDVTNQEPIDLTVDDEDCPKTDNSNLETISQVRVTSVSLKESPSKGANTNISKTKGNSVKPLKLFRATHPSILRQYNNIKHNTNIQVTTGTILNKLGGRKRLKVVNLGRRTQNLDEAKDIELNQIERSADVTVLNVNESSDSDDEPLAKRSKRNHDMEEQIPGRESIHLESVDLTMDDVLDTEQVMYEELETEFGPPENSCEDDCILGV